MYFFSSAIFLQLIVNSLCSLAIDGVSKSNNFKNCDIIDLDLSNKGLNQLAKNFSEYFCVRSLNLSKNNFEKFEIGAFSHMKILESLDLSDNKLSIENLFSFGSNDKIRNLILNNNKILKNENNSVTVYYNYTNLEKLSLRDCGIATLSDDFHLHFPKLYEIDLSKNWFKRSYSQSLMKALPVTLKNLIYEYDCNVEGLDTYFEEFSRLEVFIANGNPYLKINNDLDWATDLSLNTIYLTNLKILSLSSGYDIKDINDGVFKGFKKLKNLNLSNNDLSRKIPDDMFADMSELEILDISKTQMEQIPEISFLHNLRELYMDEVKNIINLINKEIEKPLEKVEILSLKNNNLKIIKPILFFHFERFLRNFPNLKELDLSHNGLKMLPSFSAQNKLKKLFLSSNNLKNVAFNFELDILDVRNNTLETINFNNKTLISLV